VVCKPLSVQFSKNISIAQLTSMPHCAPEATLNTIRLLEFTLETVVSNVFGTQLFQCSVHTVFNGPPCSLVVCFVDVKTVAISYSDKKNKKRNFFSRKLRTAKSKERSKSENALDIDQSKFRWSCVDKILVVCLCSDGNHVILNWTKSHQMQ